MASEKRLSVSRVINAQSAAIYELLRSPAGHVAIDSSGTLQFADGEPVQKVGDEFTVYMDRESLNDIPLGKYQVQVVITELKENALLEWTVQGRIKPPLRHRYGYELAEHEEGTLVTSYYDWSEVDEERLKQFSFPIIPESSLRASLGILARTVETHTP